jgi:nucleoside phosphorylase
MQCSVAQQQYCGIMADACHIHIHTISSSFQKRPPTLLNACHQQPAADQAACVRVNIHHASLQYACRIPPPGPCVTYSGQHCGLDVHVVWSGHDNEHNVDLIGTVPASLATYLACQAFNPDLIISAGTAGGFKARVSTASIMGREWTVAVADEC